MDLYENDRARRAANAPIKDARRPGLALLTQQGRAYERAKFRELETIFPALVIRGEDKDFDPGEERAFHDIQLANCIDRLQPNSFALEAEYEITDAFVQAHGLTDLCDGSALRGGATLSFTNVRPDILQVRPPSGQPRRIVCPSGALETIPAADHRLGLRIVDIKISGEASPAHFSELAYYGMTLAAWLETHGHGDRFVVLSEAAIWPGSHDGSTIFRLDREDRTNNVPQRDLARYLAGLEEDLEDMPPEVVLGRIKRFLALELRQVLAVPNWQDLPWHVDHRCSGCDYLGYRWSRHDDEASETNPTAGEAPDPLYCWPTAERQGHLSRVAGLTEGAAGKLREAQIIDLVSVSTLRAESAVFETHQTLRAKRTVLRERAITLAQQSHAHIPDRAGTSAVLPRFADIRVSVSADFDIGSGLTFAFGYRIDYGIPNAFQPRGIEGPRYGRQFRTIERPLLVLERSLEAEGETVRLWLNHLVSDIHQCRADVLAGYQQHGAQAKQDVTLQFFLWDRLTFDHLTRVMGRHLDRLDEPVRLGNVDVSPMAWIFPPETVLEDAEFVSKSSPLTIVSDAVNSLMAAPIPHHYGVVDLANSIDPDGRILANGARWNFHVNKFYRDPLSDQIPSERGHEIWERASPFTDRDFQAHQEAVRNVAKRKLHALSYVTEKVTRLLGDSLAAEAPMVGSVFQPADRLTSVNDDGQIIFQHARLMAAAERMEIELLMAMPPHEREARFKSARVERLLAGRERATALRAQGLANRSGDANVYVFQISDRSKEARLKEGEYTWSFLPEADLPNVQELTTARFKSLHPALARQNPIQDWDWRKKLRESLNVTILKIDRGSRLLVVEAGRLLADTLALGLLQTNIDGRQGRFGILDPIPMDVFTSKLRRSLSEQTGIRFPPIAQARPLFPNPRVARIRAGRPRVGATNSPGSEFIWNADVMAAADSGRDVGAILALALQADPNLTPRQCDAINNSVGRRLALWWGPPGTGKSRTAQAYIAGLVASHAAAGAPLRIAVTGFTWISIDNVARRVPDRLRTLGVEDQAQLFRLSSSDNPASVDPLLRDYIVPMRDNTVERANLEQRLAGSEGISIVASTVDQLFWLGDSRCAELFDVILIDEASQLDVSHAMVALTKLADGGQVTVIGDDKQMAPIHSMEPPEGIEHLLGSIYGFYRCYRQHENPDFAIEPVMLNRSFRSNREIVAFVREAGYGDDLEPADGNADLRIATGSPLTAAAPANWPDQLPWSPNYRTILDPQRPLQAVVHPDRYSSQRNDGEADLVASLVLALYRAQLMNLEAGNAQAYSPADFFRHGVGVVTPHRAQQAAVFDRLAAVLPAEVDRNDVFASIDTVERFQGQEKAVMIASFGLGDPDQIALEEEFLFSLNRFNVAASRAKAKFVAIVSRQLVDHLPHDRRVLEESRLLKHFIDGFLTRGEALDLPGLGVCELRSR